MRTIIVALVAAALGAVIGIFGFTYIVGGAGEPSAEVSAPTLDANALPTLNPTQAVAALTQVAELSAANVNLQSTIDALVAAQNAVQPTAVPTEAEAAEATQEAAVASSAGERTLYRIDSSNSQVSFALQEDLRGVRTDVIGTTTEVAGDIVIDYANPSASQIGTIRINARTIETDQSMRNRMIRSEILLSAQDAYEFIEFVPTAVNGLPATVEIGQTYTFEIVGNLTMIGVTREVTFAAEVTIASPEQISGTATANVLYSDWGISIPSVPQVANVTPEVTLTISFNANAA
jgi:polyisoprenoid-binding protein YceI